ncbi:MAG: hypothetical protein K9J13_09905 [Saprospiraceae bacterium]|nr:hypothetical protein [Saprospiraceae bacterium]
MKKRTLKLIIALTLLVTNAFSFTNKSDYIPPTGSNKNCDSVVIANNISNLSFIILEDENYIDDIPFDTEEIARQKLIEYRLAVVVLEEEAYVDDIPFNTAQIVKQYCPLKSTDSKKTKNHCCRKYCKSNKAKCIIK